MSHHLNKPLSHQESKGQEMQASQSFGQALVVACQAAKTRCPAERTFNHPTTRQEHKAALGIRQLDNFQADTLVSRRLVSVATGVALVDKGDLNGLTRHFLDSLRQLADLGT